MKEKLNMKFEPQKHPFDTAQGRHRRSIRLPDYDYAGPGAYFITIVTYRRQCLFGDIVHGETRLSAMGKIADEHWRAIPGHFPQVELGTYVIMPNHVHGILVIHENGMATNSSPSVGTRHASSLPPHGVKPKSIGAIVGSFKSSVTKRIGRELSATAIWQRNYYEHIIRDDEEHHRIHKYIEANVSNWVMDDENPQSDRRGETRHQAGIDR
jgi:putative transposase